MSLSTLFELLIAMLGVVSACYLIYAYVEFIGDMLHTEKHHFFHHNPVSYTHLTLPTTERV